MDNFTDDASPKAGVPTGSEAVARCSFTNGLRRIATERDCATKWGGDAPGVRFRCYLCGHKFAVGDGWRWQYCGETYTSTERGKAYGAINFLVCDACDGPDVVRRWLDRNAEFHSAKFWALQ